MNFYGYGSPEEVKKLIVRVCSRFHTRKLRIKMISEMVAVETQFGTYPDDTVQTGVGILQFDPIAFDDVKKFTQEHYREQIWLEFGIDINLVELSCLRYNVYLSIIFGVLKLLRIEEKIPGDLEARANYWKKYWNTQNGAGSVQDYLDAVNHWSHVIEGE